MAEQYYVVVVEYGEPTLTAPYDTHEERDLAANKIEQENAAEAVYWLDLREDGPHIGAFVAD